MTSTSYSNNPTPNASPNFSMTSTTTSVFISRANEEHSRTTSAPPLFAEVLDINDNVKQSSTTSATPFIAEVLHINDNASSYPDDFFQHHFSWYDMSVDDFKTKYNMTYEEFCAEKKKRNQTVLSEMMVVKAGLTKKPTPKKKKKSAPKKKSVTVVRPTRSNTSTASSKQNKTALYDDSYSSSDDSDHKVTEILYWVEGNKGPLIMVRWDDRSQGLYEPNIKELEGYQEQIETMFKTAPRQNSKKRPRKGSK